MNAPKIEIKTQGSVGHVIIDGHEIKGVRSADFHMNATELPIITLDLVAIDLTIDSMLVKIREKGSNQNIDSITIDGHTTNFCYPKE